MKKILMLAIILIVSLSFSRAMPNISETKLNRNDLWLGESMTISLRCIDDGNNTINSVYADVSGNGLSISGWVMEAFENNSYSLTIDGSNLYKTGDYQVDVHCKNNLDELNTEEIQFKISQLTNEINIISPNPAYLDDEINIYVFVKKDNIKLFSGVNFSVKIGNQEKEFNQHLIYNESGWNLKMEALSSIGIYDVVVKSQYNRTQAETQKQIEIKQPLQFDLLNIDKTWIKSGDNITLTFQASYKGQAIDLSKNNLKIWVDSIECEILEISRTGSYYYVKMKIPSLSPGGYNLKVRLTYQDFIKEITEKVDYIVSISGEIIDAGNKVVSAIIEFKNDKLTKSTNTDGNGFYSLEIPKGTYEVNMQFPNSKAIISGVDVSQFDDPIRYDEADSEIDIQGIGVSRIFVYEFASSFSDAQIEMRYDDSRIPDEDRIAVYRCDNWNFGKRVCNGKWNDINVDVDTIRNYVKFNTTTLSTFLVGYKKNMIIDANIEKPQYYLNDLIKVLGIVEDEEQKPVGGVKIKGKIEGTSIEFTAETDSGGVFTTEFQGPNKEGTHNILITAEKLPYTKVEQKLSLEVIKSKKLALTIPNSIKIEQGKNATTEIILNNIGQTDFQDLKISIEGIPSYYNIFETEFAEIKAGDEKKIPVIFEVPEDASIQSHTGKVKIEYNDELLEDDFILTITKIEEIQNSGSKSQKKGFSLPSAKIVLPSFSTETLLIALFSILSIGGAIWFKKNNGTSENERGDIKNLLVNIKKEVEKEPNKIRNVKTKKAIKTRAKKPKKSISYAS